MASWVYNLILVPKNSEDFKPLNIDMIGKLRTENIKEFLLDNYLH